MIKRKYIDKTLDKENFRTPNADEKQMFVDFKKELKFEKNSTFVMMIVLSLLFLATIIYLPNDLFKLLVSLVTGFMAFVSIMLFKEQYNDYKATQYHILDVSCEKIEYEDDLYDDDDCLVAVKSNNTGLVSEYMYKPMKRYLVPELNAPAKIIKVNRNYYLWLEEPVKNT